MPRRIRDGQEWGRWRYRRSNLTLETDVPDAAPRTTYDVDLRRCNNSAQILDWILHMREKVWISAADIGHLVIALDDLADGLADKVCMGGFDRDFDFAEHLGVAVRSSVR